MFATPRAPDGSQQPDMAVASRLAKVSKVATALGLSVESIDAGYRVVDATTGTMVAAAWTEPDGFGLTLDEVVAAIAVADGSTP